MGVTGPGARRVTLREAAQVLGSSKEAVRKRVRRGMLRSDVGADGRRYVDLDEGGDDVPPTSSPETSSGRPRDAGYRDELTDTLREQPAAERGEANRENRRIIATLTQRIPEIERPRDSPGPRPETRDASARPRGGCGG